MEKPIFRNRYTFKLKGTDMECIKSPSQTVKGDAYTVRELFEKHTAGIVPPIQRIGDYDDEADLDFPDPTKSPDFDLVDATQILTDIQPIKDAIEKEKNAKIKAEKAEIEELRQKLKAEKKQKQEAIKKGVTEDEGQRNDE